MRLYIVSDRGDMVECHVCLEPLTPNALLAGVSQAIEEAKEADREFAEDYGEVTFDLKEVGGVDLRELENIQPEPVPKERLYTYQKEVRGNEGIVHRPGDVVRQVRDRHGYWRDAK